MKAVCQCNLRSWALSVSISRRGGEWWAILPDPALLTKIAMWIFSSLSGRGNWGTRGELKGVWKIRFWNPILFPFSRSYKLYRVPLWTAAWNQYWTGATYLTFAGPSRHHTTTASNYLNHPWIICLCAIYGCVFRGGRGLEPGAGQVHWDQKKSGK